MVKHPPIGLIVIGRNEGDRLRKCLTSCVGKADSVVYVDSGSTDGSVEVARQMGVDVVELDSSILFSAARARNEGYQWLKSANPNIELVQFVDGDCELFQDWLQTGANALVTNGGVAIVCGRLRERYPETSLYNRICDIEWNRLPGEVDACGGIFMMRVSVFHEVGGFNPSIISGEEPELCLRIRRMGWKVLRLPQNMAWHDAAMVRFSQWWHRSVRSGHGYAEGMARYGQNAERYYFKESISIWVWAAVLPVVILCGAWPTNGLSLFLLILYPFKLWRIARWAAHLNDRVGDRWIFSSHCLLAKWPELWGQIKYWLNHFRGRQPAIIEHKISTESGNKSSVKNSSAIGQL